MLLMLIGTCITAAVISCFWDPFLPCIPEQCKDVLIKNWNFDMLAVRNGPLWVSVAINLSAAASAVWNKKRNLVSFCLPTSRNTHPECWKGIRKRGKQGGENMA